MQMSGLVIFYFYIFVQMTNGDVLYT